MIDCHAHLEQKEYDKDRDIFIDSLKKELKAVVTCCADPRDWDMTLDIIKKHRGFVFAIAGIHPEFIKDINLDEQKKFIEVIRKNSDKLVGIGEAGLDYYWIREGVWRAKQKELFIKLIKLSEETKLPLIVHSRDATMDTVSILEEHGCKNVLMHLLSDKSLLQRVIANKWFISIGPSIARSKTIKKIARDFPLDRMMLETDSPWFGQEGERGTPANVNIACEKIAEVKKTSIAEVEKQTDANAKRFFGLKI